MYETIQKTIVAWAFNHYIAYYYFDNINVNQLKVAFEKGEVELENLPIKKDALHHLNLPMDVLSGVVGKLRIKIPILTLLRDPWTINITNLMLIVSPKRKQHQDDGNQEEEDNSSLSSSTVEENMYNNTADGNDTTYIDNLLAHESGEASLVDYLDNASLDDIPNRGKTVNSEETKLAEFYSSFSATVSALVKDIYKNIRLEIDSMTILFEDFDHGLVKLNLDTLTLHRPNSMRNLVVENLHLYLSSIGPPIFGDQNDLIHIYIEKCDMNIFDEASGNMQLVLLPKNKETKKSSSVTTSETKCEGNLNLVYIEELIISDRRGGDRLNNLKTRDFSMIDGYLTSKRAILNCDTMRVEFKLTRNIDENTLCLKEKNLQIKFDLVGMRYIHSHRVHDITIKRLKDLMKFVLIINQQSSELKKNHPRDGSRIDGDIALQGSSGTSFSRLLIFNIEEGLVYMVDDETSSGAIPTLEFSLDDCRILQFSGEHQQNGFIFAKVGCNHYNRESSSWETLLHPWPFNLSWDFRSNQSHSIRSKGVQHRSISLTSDEIASFVLSSSFIDLCDVALKRIVVDFLKPGHSSLASALNSEPNPLTHGFNSIFVINNETGHRLHFAPLEQNSELFEIHEASNSFIVTGSSIDTTNNTIIHKLSTHSRSSASSRESPELGSARWMTVDPGESLPFEYETLPVYRRHVSDPSAQSRILLIRVEGWKTLLPLVIDKTGLFFREAYSDRVVNEDTHIAISIDLEESSARKIISVRSPLNFINHLDSTLEIHFVEAKQALYIKPNDHLAVPLPFLHNQMHIRPCNVGVTMSERAILWEDIQNGHSDKSRIHICHPITVTDLRHASYSNSQPYRVCVSTRREVSREYANNRWSPDGAIPVFSLTLDPPLKLVNLLPCQIRYAIGELEGFLDMGKEEKINFVDTTKSNELFFTIEGFPKSKPVHIDLGATGNFYQTIELLDRKNRSLFLQAKVMLSEVGEEPAIQVLMYAPFWFINKTGLPLIFKQEGAALEAAGQYQEDEKTSRPINIFSFYDTDLEPPWLCCMRLGESEGSSTWCEGFTLDKGSGERRIYYFPKGRGIDVKKMKHLIDIDIRRGLGRYSETTLVTFSVRYGFDPSTKTPKKPPVPSPHNYKLTSYNHNTNLAERIAGQAMNLFNNHYHKSPLEVNVVLPGFQMTLMDSDHEKLIDGSVKDITFKCSTRAKEQIIDCTVQDVRIENSLPDCENCVMLDRAFDSDENVFNRKPALRIIMDRVLGSSFGATLFRQVQLTTCELVLNIEEKLFLKLVEFISFGRRRKRNTRNLSQDLEKNLRPDGDRHSKYYFDLLRIDLTSLQLSVFSSNNLPESLQRLKTSFGLKFFNFEDAKLKLSPYFKMNVSRTFRGVFESVTRFYKKQILEQAPRIVGQQIQSYLRFHLSDVLSTLYDEVYNKLFN